MFSFLTKDFKASFGVENLPFCDEPEVVETIIIQEQLGLLKFSCVDQDLLTWVL